VTARAVLPLPAPLTQSSPPTEGGEGWVRGLWQPYLVTIRDIQPETPGVATYTLDFLDRGIAESYRFRPGQFNMLYVPGVGESAISISSDPEAAGTLLHTIRAAGNVTQALARKRPGDRIGLRGPFGSSWPMDEARGQDVVIACGGIGLAPLRPVIYHILRHRADYGRVMLLYGARTPGDLLYRAEYNTWREAGIEVEVTVDIGADDWRGNIGVVPVLFCRLRLKPAHTRVLTCGPEVMIHFVIFEALARRIPPAYIHLSMERNMSCAVGLCGHCQFGPVFVCKDGPVFTYERLQPYLHVEEF
jgi:NAD(P)H-flavin reductase